MIPEKRKYKRKYRFTYKNKNNHNQDEEENEIYEMDSDQSAFIHMRNEIKNLILEISLKANNLDFIYGQMIDISNSIITNTQNVSTEELDLRIEAVLMVFYHFLESTKRNIKIKNYQETKDKLTNFFLNENKEFFSENKSHCLVTKKYIDCLIQLKYFLKSDSEKEDLVYVILGILFQDNILMSGNPGTISYYMQTFITFIQKNIQSIDEEN